jgi:hypothetical protein
LIKKNNDAQLIAVVKMTPTTQLFLRSARAVLLN